MADSVEEDLANGEDLFVEELEITDVQSVNKELTNKKCIIVSVNIRSLNANIDKLNVFINSLDNKPSVIICTESWNLHGLAICNLNGYDSYFNESKINKADGVVFFVKKGLNNEITHETVENLKVISCLFTCGSEKIKISGVYRCHDYKKEIFIKNVLSYLILNKRFRNHYIFGDFNIDMINTDEDAQNFLYNFLEYHYTSFFQKITRPNDNNVNGGTCIDNCFAKTTLTCKSYKINQVVCDHFPLFITIDKNIDNIPHVTQDKFLNYKKLNKLAQIQLWHKLLSIQDPDMATNVLIDMIKTITVKAQTKKNRFKDKNIARKNWITQGIVISCNTKEILYNMWKANPENTILRQNFKNM
ncbi:uncharacterized protein LOC112494347 [Cephus cinctus]|uniref:Uncharacterized protein LOC112494347 n=1 Tax=Cephus cinctus TaxID=211228 RepID=A0AAJ7RHL4_CEPCN|nr:uncharacterized protein LOC112494347 [Cephus cinctus]